MRSSLIITAVESAHLMSGLTNLNGQNPAQSTAQLQGLIAPFLYHAYKSSIPSVPLLVDFGFILPAFGFGSYCVIAQIR